MSVLLQNLVFSYPDSIDSTVLDIESWSVEANEQVFLCGPSGSGKSTLLNLLSGLLVATRGKVSVLDKHLEKMRAYQRDQFRAAHIGYVFQQFNLIPYLDAVDNIRLATFFSPGSPPKSQVISHIQALLQQLNIKRSQWSRPASKLSIGQQQRIAIARALINRPGLIIVDEPTSSLDRKNRDAFMSLLLSILRDHPATLIFVSHDMALSQYFNRVDSLTAINRVSQSSLTED